MMSNEQLGELLTEIADEYEAIRAVLESILRVLRQIAEGQAAEREDKDHGRDSS